MSNAVRIRNAAETALYLVQREFPDYHPLTALARMAHSQKVLDDPALELQVHKTILPYVSPRLANVEVKVDTNPDRRVIVSLFEDLELEDGRIVDVEVPLLAEAGELVPLD